MNKNIRFDYNNGYGGGRKPQKGNGKMIAAILIAAVIVFAGVVIAALILKGGNGSGNDSEPTEYTKRSETVPQTTAKPETSAAEIETSKPVVETEKGALLLSSSSANVVLSPRNISLNESALTLKPSETFDLMAYVDYGEAKTSFNVIVTGVDDTSVSVYSSDKNIASVSLSKNDNITTVEVTAKKEGTAIITVTSNGDSSLSQTFGLKAEADYSAEYKSSNTGVASVSGYTVTAVSVGRADITVKMANGLSAVCSVTVKKETLDVKVGDSILFGSYEQDNNSSNGKEKIKWLVLAVEGGKALVLSEYGLDCVRYSPKDTPATWETSSLRSWMNGDFYNTAFNDDEKALILSSSLPSDKNPNYSTDPGKATTDKVFALSASEAKKYLRSKEMNQCVPTAYALAQNAWVSDEYFKEGKKVGFWWLRTPGMYNYYAVDMNYRGEIYYEGVNSGRCSARPAMWIDINS